MGATKKTFITTLLLSFVALINGSELNETTKVSQVVFYEKANFDSLPYVVIIPASQTCINLPCYSQKAASAKWKNLPTSGKNRIAFYSYKNCYNHYKSYASDADQDEYFANDFSDGYLLKRVTSVMVWTTSMAAEHPAQDAPCLVKAY